MSSGSGSEHARGGVDIESRRDAHSVEKYYRSLMRRHLEDQQKHGACCFESGDEADQARKKRTPWHRRKPQSPRRDNVESYSNHIENKLPSSRSASSCSAAARSRVHFNQQKCHFGSKTRSSSTTAAASYKNYNNAKAPQNTTGVPSSSANINSHSNLQTLLTAIRGPTVHRISRAGKSSPIKMIKTTQASRDNELQLLAANPDVANTRRSCSGVGSNIKDAGKKARNKKLHQDQLQPLGSSSSSGAVEFPLEGNSPRSGVRDGDVGANADASTIGALGQQSDAALCTAGKLLDPSFTVAQDTPQRQMQKDRSAGSFLRTREGAVGSQVAPSCSQGLELQQHSSVKKAAPTQKTTTTKKSHTSTVSLHLEGQEIDCNERAAGCGNGSPKADSGRTRATALHGRTAALPAGLLPCTGSATKTMRQRASVTSGKKIKASLRYWHSSARGSPSVAGRRAGCGSSYQEKVGGEIEKACPDTPPLAPRAIAMHIRDEKCDYNTRTSSCGGRHLIMEDSTNDGAPLPTTTRAPVLEDECGQSSKNGRNKNIAPSCLQPASSSGEQNELKARERQANRRSTATRQRDSDFMRRCVVRPTTLLESASLKAAEATTFEVAPAQEHSSTSRNQRGSGAKRHRSRSSCSVEEKTVALPNRKPSTDALSCSRAVSRQFALHQETALIEEGNNAELGTSSTRDVPCTTTIRQTSNHHHTFSGRRRVLLEEEAARETSLVEQLKRASSACHAQAPSSVRKLALRSAFEQSDFSIGFPPSPNRSRSPKKADFSAAVLEESQKEAATVSQASSRRAATKTAASSTSNTGTSEQRGKRSAAVVFQVSGSSHGPFTTDEASSSKTTDPAGRRTLMPTSGVGTSSAQRIAGAQQPGEQVATPLSGQNVDAAVNKKQSLLQKFKSRVANVGHVHAELIGKVV